MIILPERRHKTQYGVKIKNYCKSHNQTLLQNIYRAFQYSLNLVYKFQAQQFINILHSPIRGMRSNFLHFDVYFNYVTFIIMKLREEKGVS